MQLATYNIPKEEARQQWQALLTSQNETPLNLARKRVYHAMSKEQRVLDIYTAMEQAGQNELLEPRIAICRADAKTCYFYPWQRGAGTFSGESSPWNLRNMKKEPVRFAAGTFKPFLASNATNGFSSLSTPVPQIPAEHVPKGALKNYYILWEVDNWTQQVTRDPLLLRRLSKNMFTILAEWNLSDLEWSIARGAI